MDWDAVEKAYKSNYTNYERLVGEVKFVIERELVDAGIVIDAIEKRVKTLGSIRQNSEKYQLTDPLNQLNDICGLRIVCLFRSDLPKICDVLNRALSLKPLDDKSAGKPDDAFGYASIHLDGTLPDSFKGHRYDELKGMRFEIQVRTLAMHSWAAISRHLDYKSANAIPATLRKDFYALSALFHLADSTFELLHKESQNAQAQAEISAASADPLKADINLNTLKVYLEQKYPSRKHSDNDSVSELIEELVKAGYRTLMDLENKLAGHEEIFREYELQHPPVEGSFADVGVVRSILSILSEDFVNARKQQVPPVMRRRFEDFRARL